jgi:vacuolar-type H+-ATPase subunit C/Vma6
MFSAVGYAAVQARVRARRSRLLDGAAWRRLIGLSRSAGVVDALLTTPYGPHLVALADAAAPASSDPDDVARARLERALQRRLDDETRELSELVPPRARDLLDWYASAALVQDLKLLVRALHHGRGLDEALAASVRIRPEHPVAHELSRSRTLDALLQGLGRGPYAHALGQAWERYRLEGRAFYLEVALDLAFGRGLVERIEALGGADRADAVSLLGVPLARTNLLSAVRYRALAGVSPEEIVNFCLHRDLGGGLAMVQRVAAGASVWDEAAALGVLLAPDQDERSALLELERITERDQRTAANRRIGRMPFGIGLVLAYLIELAAEGRDLTTLVEAKGQDLDDTDLRQRVQREVT